MLEDRYAKNLHLVMKMEYGPVGEGYDFCSYRL